MLIPRFDHRKFVYDTRHDHDRRCVELSILIGFVVILFFYVTGVSNHFGKRCGQILYNKIQI